MTQACVKDIREEISKLPKTWKKAVIVLYRGKEIHKT